jgi:hypothetical protein
MIDNEIRTLSLRFKDAETATRFESLAKRYGYGPAWAMEGDWVKLTIIFQNKADRSELLSAWRMESMEVNEQLTFR